MSDVTSDPNSHALTISATPDQTRAEHEPLQESELPPIDDLRRYKVVREFARGGLGRILEVQDTTLNRRVAVKELRVSGGRGRVRFLREAMITARLQHPSIVPLYDLSMWDSGEPFYAMKLVSGRSLDDVIASAKTLDARLALIPHVVAVADAIAYAHSQRIIHRDLKPANILVGEFGETIVIDWGLAKDLDQQAADTDEADDGPYRTAESPSRLTQAGEVLGTPVYMAPEQARDGHLDERADVYAIGAILYQLLTGRWPHTGISTHEVVARLIAGEPFVAVDVAQPGVPTELATIVNKAMAFAREDRYPNASELAGELRRFQTGQLVAAHHYSRGVLARRWIRRHRTPLLVAAALTAALAVTGALGIAGIIRERDATRAERDRLILAQAAGELERDPTAAVELLHRYPKSGREPARQHELMLDAKARGIARHVLPRSSIATMGEFSPDGTMFVQPGATGARVIELATGRQVATSTAGQLDATWSSDGARLLLQGGVHPGDATLYSMHGEARLLPVKLEPIWQPHQDPLAGSEPLVRTVDHRLARVRADSTSVAVWSPRPLDSYVHVGDRIVAIAAHEAAWWTVTETAPHALDVPADVTLADDSTTYVMTADGELVAGTTDGRLCTWRLPGREVRTLGTTQTSPINTVTVASDGATVVTQSDDDTIRVWNLRTGSSTALPPPGGVVTDLALSDDGRRLAVGLKNHEVLAYDVATGDRHHIGIHPAPIHRVAISHDGRWIASDGDDDTTRLWEVPALDELYAPAEYSFAAIAVSSQGAVIGGTQTGHLIVWAGGHRQLLEAHTGVVLELASAGSLLASAGLDQAIRLWDLSTGAPRGTLAVTGGIIKSLAVTRDGGRVISAHNDGRVIVWDVATATPRTLATLRDVRKIGVSPDETLVAAGDGDGVVQLIPVSGGPPRVLGRASGRVWTARFSPDGRHVATAGLDGAVIVWDVATGASREVAHVHAKIHGALEYSPDGHWLAAASDEGEIVVWDVEREQLRTWTGHKGEIAELGFVSGLLVTGGHDGSVRSWNPRDGALVALARIDGGVVALAFGEGIVAAGSTNGSAYRWTADRFR